MRSRFLTNLLAVVLIGAAFLGVTSIINLMAATDEVAQHEFSFLKRTGDQHWNDKNSKEAARYYKELAEKDEFNVGAQLAYAWNLLQQIPAEIRKDNTGDGQVKSAETEALVREAIAAFEKTKKSTQFRNISRVQLCYLHGLLGETEASIPYIVLALGEGYPLRNLRTHDINSEVMSDPRVKAAINLAAEKR